MEFFKKKLLCALHLENEHFRRHAHALRFAVGLHGTQKFHPIVKYKHYQISSGTRASLVQRRAARFVNLIKGNANGMFESVTQMLEQFTWIPLSKKTRKNSCLILFYKIINNLNRYALLYGMVW